MYSSLRKLPHPARLDVFPAPRRRTNATASSLEAASLGLLLDLLGELLDLLLFLIVHNLGESNLAEEVGQI